MAGGEAKELHQDAVLCTVSRRAGRRPMLEAGERRSRVLDAAARVFLQNGYALATVDAIAVVAGMSKKTLYQVFPSKLALFDALLKDRFTQMPIPDDRAGDPQDDRLTRLMLAIATMLLDPGRTALVRLIIADGQVSPELLTAFERLEIGQDLNQIEEWIAREAHTGRLAVDDVPAAARLLFGMTVAEPILASLVKAPRPGDEPTLEDWIRQGVRIFLRGLRP